jgi:hypothetical protein
MTDFVSILRGDRRAQQQRPEMRGRVYQRGQVTLWTRLALIGPPPATVVERHTRALEEAIANVQGLYGGESQGNQSTSPIDDRRNEQSCKGEAPADLQLPTSNGQPQEASTDRPNFPTFKEQAAAEHCDDSGGPTHVSRPVAAAALEQAEPTLSVELTKAFTCNLEWPDSSRCAICSKWATCVDLEQCWNRVDADTVVLNPRSRFGSSAIQL